MSIDDALPQIYEWKIPRENRMWGYGPLYSYDQCQIMNDDCPPQSLDFIGWILKTMGHLVKQYILCSLSLFSNFFVGICIYTFTFSESVLSLISVYFPNLFEHGIGCLLHINTNRLVNMILEGLLSLHFYKRELGPENTYNKSLTYLAIIPSLILLKPLAWIYQLIF